MFTTRFRATLKLSRSNTKLATVNVVLMLLMNVLSLPLLSRGGYFYISNITYLVVHKSREQCKRKISFGTYNYTGWHTSQALIRTEYIYVAREYMIHTAAYHVLRSKTNSPAQSNYTVFMMTKLLCSKLESVFLGRKLNINSLQNLHCPHKQFTTFRLTNCALKYALHVAHVTLCSMLFFSRAQFHCSFPLRTILSDQSPHTSHCLSS